MYDLCSLILYIIGMQNFFLNLLFLCLTYSVSTAQTYSIFGKLADTKDSSELINVNVLLNGLRDTSFKQGTVTALDGSFSFNNIPSGPYKLEFSYISYKDVAKKVFIKDSDVQLNTIFMEEDSKLLKEVTVQGTQIRVLQKGDTSQFNADAFKTNKDATTEDLLTKMPGVSSENGTVKVNGEEVKKVLVDGKAYFGDDTRTAIQNLPAEVIDKIQVFDKLSDQSSFTGFDDGNSQKTINIITKNGLGNSKMGRFYAGYGGPNNRYTVGLNYNDFKKDRRFSILAMSNNINIQNFSVQDLVGAMGSGGRSGGGGRGGPSGMGRNNPINNMMTYPQSGISTTTALGINYADKWGKKDKVNFSGSYFFNASKNINNSATYRNYLSSVDSGVVYTENQNTLSKNFNNRMNMRIEYNIDSNNTIIFTPTFTTQYYNTHSSTIAASNTTESILNSLNNQQSSKQKGYTFSNEVLYQHKLHKQGRTISMSLQTSANIKNTTGTLNSNSNYWQDTILTMDSLNQQSGLHAVNYTIGGSIVYTEPIKKTGQISLTYNPTFTNSQSDKSTYNYEAISDNYTSLDSALSNRFNNKYITNKLGIAYRYNKDKLRWMLGLNGQSALLNSTQSFPYTFTVKKHFLSLLPNAEFNYKFSNTENIRINYRTSTNAPSVSQLQNVIDNSNSLLLSTGNPELKQSFAQNVMMRYGRSNTKNATNFFVYAMFNNTRNNISTSTQVLTNDTIIQNIAVNKGTQLSMPVNLNGYWNARTFITYGFPITKIKCNMNVNAGFTFTRTPTLINLVLNKSNTYAMNGGFVLSSNISKKIDFTIMYNGSYNIVRNSAQQNNNSNYYSHIASAKINYQFWKGFVFNSGVTHQMNAGGSSNYNTSYWLLNASLAYKFLKDESLEVKFSANDILNQNKNITRNVTETYIEDVTTTTLQRYFLGTITYTLRKMGNNAKNMDEKPKEFMMPPPPQGGPGMAPPPPGM